VEQWLKINIDRKRSPYTEKISKKYRTTVAQVTAGQNIHLDGPESIKTV
jgi:hypothetical protein